MESEVKSKIGAPTVALRPLHGDDIAAVQALYESADDFFTMLTGEPAANRQAEIDYAALLAQAGRVWLGIFTPDAQGQPDFVGLLDARLAHPTSNAATVGILLIRPDLRRLGFGTHAYQLFENWLQQQRVESVVLHAPGQAFGPQQFWRSLGFEFTGKQMRVSAGQKSVRLLEMTKLLSSHETKNA